MAGRIVTPPKPPAPPRPPKAPTPIKTGNVQTVDTWRRPASTAAIASAPSVTTPSVTTTTPFKPDAGWWTQQFSADPRWLQNAPGFRAAEEGLGAKYGYQIQRTATGQPIFKSASTGVGGITQVLDASGNPVLSDTGAFQYKDAQGNTYSPADLQMDIRELQPGQAGYLEGQLGGTTAASAVRQQDVGESAAKAGVGRSGMRAYGAASETQALQTALRNLGVSAASEFGGLSQQQRNLYNTIYADLAKSAGEIPPTETTTPGTTIPPAPTTTAGAGRGEYGGVQVPQKPLPSEKTMSIAGQNVTFPKGINLAGVNVEAIGKRIAGNVAAVGGVGKLKPGQRVGEFRAGDRGYRVFYRGGRFVIEAIG